MKTILGFALLGIFLVLIGPLLVIWAMNTLFPALEIPYSIETWIAVIIIASLFKVRVERT